MVDFSGRVHRPVRGIPRSINIPLKTAAIPDDIRALLLTREILLERMRAAIAREKDTHNTISRAMSESALELCEIPAFAAFSDIFKTLQRLGVTPHNWKNDYGLYLCINFDGSDIFIDNNGCGSQTYTGGLLSSQPIETPMSFLVLATDEDGAPYINFKIKFTDQNIEMTSSVYRPLARQSPFALVSKTLVKTYPDTTYQLPNKVGEIGAVVGGGVKPYSDFIPDLVLQFYRAVALREQSNTAEFLAPITTARGLDWTFG